MVPRLHTVLLLAPLAGCSSAEADPPNVVVIVVDTLRADHLGLYGYPRPTSPNLDALSRESFVFENAQSSAPWTAPSLMSLMTSLYPDVHQVETFPFPPRTSENVTTLAEVLSERGYATGAFTEGGFAKGDFGLDQGFDSYPSHPGDDESHASNLRHPSRIEKNVDRSIAWLEGVAHRPFFLFFQTFEVHGPYHALDEPLQALRATHDPAAEKAALQDAVETWNRAEPLTEPHRKTLAFHSYHCHWADARGVRRRTALYKDLLASGHLPAEKSPETLGGVIDLYDAEIRRTDGEIQRLLDALDRLGVADETIVVVTSDHGEGLGDHGRLDHGRLLFDELLRAVLVIRDPRHPAPGRIGGVARTVDVMPTLLDLLAIEDEGLAMQGVSLAPRMNGDAAPGEDYAFSHSLSIEGDQVRPYTVRTSRWRYVESAEGTGALYDLDSDPAESTDVGGENAEVLDRLRGVLADQKRRDVELRERIGGEARPVVIDEDMRQDLEGLGYIGDEKD